MSWLSSAIKGLGHAAVDVGHTVGKVASNPWVDGAVGLIGGPGAAAAVGGLGHLMAPGGNLGSAVKGAVTGGAAGYAGSKIGALTGIGNMIHGGGGSAGGEYDPTNPTAGSVPSAGSSVPGLQSIEGLLGKVGSGIGGAVGGLVGQAGNFLTGNGGTNALATAEGVNAALLQSKANDYAKNALGTAQASYDARAPLRSAGIQGMMNPSAGIAPKLAAIPQGPNPYATAGAPGVGAVR